MYNKFLFSLGHPVAPVGLTASVPVLPLVPGQLGSSVARELFWLLFAPCVVYTVRWLPLMTASAGEDAPAFARRVQVWEAVAWSNERGGGGWLGGDTAL